MFQFIALRLVETNDKVNKSTRANTVPAMVAAISELCSLVCLYFLTKPRGERELGACI